MPRKHPRTRVERGLYREGQVFWACATPIGSRQVVWGRLGSIGLMEARRRRDEFVVRTRAEPAASTSARATTFAEMAARRLEVQEQRVAAGELRPRTLEIYEQGSRLPVLPELGRRPIRPSRPTTSCVASRGLRRACATADLDGVTFHVFRHAFASVLIGQAHDPVFVSRQLGHANPAITLRVYAHLFDGSDTPTARESSWTASSAHMLDRGRAIARPRIPTNRRGDAAPTPRYVRL